jgi:hypothetical protein
MEVIEALIYIIGFFTIWGAVRGSAIWVSDNFSLVSTDELEKINRLQDRLLSKAA